MNQGQISPCCARVSNQIGEPSSTPMRPERSAATRQHAQLSRRDNTPLLAEAPQHPHRHDAHEASAQSFRARGAHSSPQSRRRRTPRCGRWRPSGSCCPASARRQAGLAKPARWPTLDDRRPGTQNLLTDGQNPWYVAAQLGHEDVEMEMVFALMATSSEKTEAEAGIAHCGKPVIGAIRVRNRCEFQDTAVPRMAKKNRHRLVFPVCGGVLGGGAGGN